MKYNIEYVKIDLTEVFNYQKQLNRLIGAI